MIFILLILLILTSCKNVDKLLKSDNAADIMEANILIGERKDTTYVCELFSNIFCPEMESNHFKLKGLSVYQTKVTALYEISGLKPPRKITFIPDTLIVEFYKEWARKKHYNCPYLKRRE